MKPFPNSLLTSDATIWDDVLATRERGVIFDIGHGRASFGFAVARGMLANGFMPDVISSDVYALNRDGAVSGLLSVLSKFYSLGCDAPAIIRAAGGGAAPARSRASRHRRGWRRDDSGIGDRRFRVSRRRGGDPCEVKAGWPSEG